jgi:D-alanine-D-alanine ligase
LKKIRIGILFGGRSAEHQVSLVSAQSIINALDKNRYEIIPIGITQSGQWISGKEALSSLIANQPNKCDRVYLPADPTQQNLLPGGQKLDVVFPVVHGTFGEDGTLQGLLELADIPYVGAGVLGSSLSMDKILQKQICLQVGIPCVEYLWLKGADWTNPLKDAPKQTHQLANMSQEIILEQIVKRLGLPVFVKPPNLGSSVGISKAHSKTELKDAIELALKYDRKVLIEKSIENAREIEVSVLGNEKPKASVAGEVLPSNEFYDYDAKYVDGASDLKIPAELPEQLHLNIRNMAIKTAIAVEVEGMARVDFLLDPKTDKFYLNELNTIPGFTSISMYPKLWQATGLDYPDLLDELVQLAFDRFAQKKKLQLSYQPKQDWYTK